MMKGNINLISYDCYQQATEKQLADEMKSYVDKGRKGKKIRVMIVGIPNVGKSSFINRIAKSSF